MNVPGFWVRPQDDLNYTFCNKYMFLSFQTILPSLMPLHFFYSGSFNCEDFFLIGPATIILPSLNFSPSRNLDISKLIILPKWHSECPLQSVQWFVRSDFFYHGRYYLALCTQISYHLEKKHPSHFPTPSQAVEIIIFPSILPFVGLYNKP